MTRKSTKAKIDAVTAPAKWSKAPKTVWATDPINGSELVWRHVTGRVANWPEHVSLAGSRSEFCVEWPKGASIPITSAGYISIMHNENEPTAVGDHYRVQKCVDQRACSKS